LLACHDPLLDPLTIADKASGKKVAEADPLLDDDYLDRLPEHYVAASKLAHKAGFQFVDIKQCHRYLLNEILAAKNRPGRYGGSFENRTTLARNIFTALKSEVPELMIATRLNVFDSVPFRKKAEDGIGEPCSDGKSIQTSWGTSPDNPLEADLTEPIQWLRQMQQLGVALINLSMGNPYASPHILRPFEYPPIDGYLPPEHPLIGVDRHFRLAAILQKEFPEFPMVGSGYSFLQEFLFQAGAANQRDGRIAFVGVGRASLAQPDFARRLQEGNLDRKRVCRTFSYCTALMRSKHNAQGQFATGCPPFDKEIYGPIWEEARNRYSGQ
jgi:2,4-dienoyl-CoA reductase-like NADH-dependent reductase (Old Yellow Enzyme family)